jgi:hypothetical protein
LLMKAGLQEAFEHRIAKSSRPMRPRINLTFRVVNMEIIEFKSIQLQLNNDPAIEDPWVEAWYDLPNGNCLAEKFVVLQSGQPIMP